MLLLLYIENYLSEVRSNKKYQYMYRKLINQLSLKKSLIHLTFVTTIHTQFYKLNNL